MRAERIQTPYEAGLCPGLEAPIDFFCPTSSSQRLSLNYQMRHKEPDDMGAMDMILPISQIGPSEARRSSAYGVGDWFSPRTFCGSQTYVTGAEAAIPLPSQCYPLDLARGTQQAYTNLLSTDDLSQEYLFEPPQTVRPSQTTYTLPKTPSPVLGRLSTSPVRHSPGSIPIKNEEYPTSPLENMFLYSDGDLESPGSSISNSSSYSCASSILKSEGEEGRATIFAHDAKQRTRRREIKGGWMRKMRIPVKREPGPQHACHSCDKRFKRTEHRHRHEKSVHGDTYQTCRVCGVRSKGRPDNMDTHVRNRHLYADAPSENKSKKGPWLTVEEARKLGYGGIDPRTEEGRRKRRGKKVEDEDEESEI